ncbi:MAG TPA: hypothetical protein VMR23_09225 [Candidatus Limnocylindria bacterium]|nr:hypothetical protein [Candidatus Limnocylindria bacterium]
MTARVLVAAVVVVVAVEVAVTTATGEGTHLLPGGFTIFGILGALALVRLAKALGAIGVQEPAPDDRDD